MICIEAPTGSTSCTRTTQGARKVFGHVVVRVLSRFVLLLTVFQWVYFEFQGDNLEKAIAWKDGENCVSLCLFVRLDQYNDEFALFRKVLGQISLHMDDSAIDFATIGVEIALVSPLLMLLFFSRGSADAMTSIEHMARTIAQSSHFSTNSKTNVALRTMNGHA